MNLKQGEVQSDAEARSHSDQPGAVGRVGVLFRVRRREDGAVVRRDVAAARHWWRKEGRGQGIFIYQRAVNTSGQIHYSAAIVEGGGRGEKGGWMWGWGWIFHPRGLLLPLLGVSLPLFFALRLVPRRLSGLKISQQSLLASGGSDGVFL